MTNSRFWPLLLPFAFVLRGEDTSNIGHFESLIKDQNYAQAVEELGSYTVAHPDSWQAFYQLGYVEFRLHKIQSSLNALCRSLVLNKNFADSHKILAFDLNMLGHQDMAIHELTEAIRCEPSSEEAHYELGRILYEQGSYLKSVEQLEMAKSLSPQSVRTYPNLGLAYSAVGETDKAVTNFEEGLRLNALQKAPSAWPLIDYATYFNTRNEHVKARDLLLQSLQMERSWDQAYSELSKAYRGLNQPESAISALQRAITLNAQNAEYHYMLARLYTEIQHPQEAAQEIAAYQSRKTNASK